MSELTQIIAALAPAVATVLGAWIANRNRRTHSDKEGD